MPIYGWVCDDCGNYDEEYSRIEAGPSDSMQCDCGQAMHRFYEPPYVTAPFVEHWNHSVGRRVSSMKDFKSALSQGADEASQKNNHDVSYVPIEPGDKEGIGVDEQGMDATRRERRRVGLDEPTKTHFIT